MMESPGKRDWKSGTVWRLGGINILFFFLDKLFSTHTA
jgi:hypothetical protein